MPKNLGWRHHTSYNSFFEMWKTRRLGPRRRMPLPVQPTQVKSTFKCVAIQMVVVVFGDTFPSLGPSPPGKDLSGVQSLQKKHQALLVGIDLLYRK